MVDAFVGTRKSDRGVFDQLLAWADSLRKSGQYPFGLEEEIIVLEGLVRDINNEAIDEEVKKLLSYWCEIVSTEEEQGVTVANVIQIGMAELLDSLSKWQDSNSNKSVVAAIQEIEPVPPRDWIPVEIHSSESDERELRMMKLRQELAKLEHKFSKEIAHNNELGEVLVTMVKEVQENFSSGETSSYMEQVKNFFGSEKGWVKNLEKKDSLHSNDPSEGAQIIWTIEVRFYSESNSALVLGNVLSALSGGLESIPGVQVTVGQIEDGSVIVRLNTWFKNFWSRERAKHLLDVVRDTVKTKLLMKHPEEIEKIRQERLKIEQERKILDQEIETLPRPSTITKLREIDLKEKEEKLRKLELENQGRILKNKMAELELIEKAGEIIASGLLKAPALEIRINDKDYIRIENEKISIGTSMDEIAGKEKLIESKSKAEGSDIE